MMSVKLKQCEVNNNMRHTVTPATSRQHHNRNQAYQHPTLITSRAVHMNTDTGPYMGGRKMENVPCPFLRKSGLSFVHF